MYVLGHSLSNPQLLPGGALSTGVHTGVLHTVDIFIVIGLSPLQEFS